MNKGSTLAVVAMIFGAAVMVYPYAFMLSSSFKTRKEFAEDRQSLIPARYQPSHILADMRSEESARDWPGADWPLYQNYVDAIRYGQRVTVVSLPPPAVLAGASGLKVVGPHAFGYDVAYSPLHG